MTGISRSAPSSQETAENDPTTVWDLLPPEEWSRISAYRSAPLPNVLGAEFGECDDFPDDNPNVAVVTFERPVFPRFPNLSVEIVGGEGLVGLIPGETDTRFFRVRIWRDATPNLVLEWRNNSKRKWITLYGIAGASRTAIAETLQGLSLLGERALRGRPLLEHEVSGNWIGIVETAEALRSKHPTLKWDAIARRLEVSPSTLSRWRARYRKYCWQFTATTTDPS